MGRGIAHVLHQAAQAFDHLLEGMPQGVALRTGLDFQRQISAGNRFGNRGHFLQVLDHDGEGARQFSDLVFPLDINVVLEVAGVADLLRYAHQVVQRFCDGLGSGKCDEDSQAHSDQSADQRDASRGSGSSLIRMTALFYRLLVFLAGHIQVLS